MLYGIPEFLRNGGSFPFRRIRDAFRLLLDYFAFHYKPPLAQAALSHQGSGSG